MSSILSIEGLDVYFLSVTGRKRVVCSLDISVREGEVYSLIGASGSGKSVLLKSILRLLPKNTLLEGRILYKNFNLLDLAEDELNRIRGKEITIVFQDPMSSLNPTMKVGDQVAEVLESAPRNGRLSKREIKEMVYSILEEVGLKNPKVIYNLYPHHLSGGMRQRVMIAMALIAKPNVMLLDEPTTALDVTLQLSILELIVSEIRRRNISALFVTHDFSVVSIVADRVGVIYKGYLVEEGKREDVLKNPLHPYTKALIDVIPTPVRGKFILPFTLNVETEVEGYSKSCPFYRFCNMATEECSYNVPEMVNVSDSRRVRCIKYLGGV
ncbi:MAG: ABC transporter ATP-binding protein [Thermosulfidibacteraceae bacterium]|jgi:oligopeptide/dipeptide ABC transporter ATP-binding protein